MGGASRQRRMADEQQQEDALFDALRSRLVQQGEYDRLLQLLRTKLDHSGWQDHLRAHARDKVRVPDAPRVPELVEQITPFAQQTLPDDVRRELGLLVRQFIDQNVED